MSDGDGSFCRSVEILNDGVWGSCLPGPCIRRRQRLTAKQAEAQRREAARREQPHFGQETGHRWHGKPHRQLMITNEFGRGHDGIVGNAVQTRSAFPTHKHVVCAQIKCKIKLLRKAVVFTYVVALADVVNV